MRSGSLSVSQIPMRRLRFSDTAVLKLLTFFFSAAPIVPLLFLNIVSRQDAQLASSVGLTGANILSSIFSGSLEVYSYSSTLRLVVPGFLTAALLAALILQTAAAALSFIGKKGRFAAGILSIVTVGMLAVFMTATMLSAGFQTTDFSGASTAFYKLYSYGLGFAVAIFLAVFAFITGSLVKVSTIPMIKRHWFMYFLLFIPMLLLLIFSFYPILLQTVLSFKDYKSADGVFGSAWVGLANFRKIFTDPEMGLVIWNTIYISFIRLIMGLLPPIILALMIYEITQSKLQKAVQTITYIPHFFSWVIIYGIVFAFLAPNGIVNNIILSFGKTGVDFLTNDKYFITILVVSAIWKELGWSTIIYLAALTSVDTELYDAASVDGVTPLKKLWYITLPEIMPVIAFLTILAIGNLLKGAGGEQILLMANSAVMDKAKVIDTWVYWQGLGNLQYGLGAAVSFFQSGIGVIMVLLANKISVKLVGRGLW